MKDTMSSQFIPCFDNSESEKMFLKFMGAIFFDFISVSMGCRVIIDKLTGFYQLIDLIDRGYSFGCMSLTSFQ